MERSRIAPALSVYQYLLLFDNVELFLSVQGLSSAPVAVPRKVSSHLFRRVIRETSSVGARFVAKRINTIGLRLFSPSLRARSFWDPSLIFLLC